MKKLVAVMVALAISATLFGCGGQPEKSEPKSTAPASSATQQAKPEKLKVIESGWSAAKSGYIHYGIGIENPNTSFEADFPTINVIGKDAAGKVLRGRCCFPTSRS